MNHCTFLTCGELEQLINITEKAKIRKDISFNMTLPERVLHCLIYKLVYYSSKISVAETLRYLKLHPDNNNIFAIKEKYDKYIFDNLLCFISAIETYILCIKKEKGDIEAKNQLDFIVNSLLGKISVFLDEQELQKDDRKVESFEHLNDFFTEQIEDYLSTVQTNCTGEFLNSINRCRQTIKQNYSKFDTPVDPVKDAKIETQNVLSIIKDHNTEQTVYLTEKDNELDIYTTIEQKASMLPEYSMDLCKRLASTICNACYHAKGYVPRPVKCAFNVFYSLIQTITPFVPVAILLTQGLFLTSSNMVLSSETKQLLTNTIVVLEATKQILPNFINTSDLVKTLTTSETDVDNPSLLIKSQEKALLNIFSKSSKKVSMMYKKQLKEEQKALQTKRKEEEKALQARLREQNELEKERRMLQRQTELVNYEYQLKQQQKQKEIQSIVDRIANKIAELKTLQDEYKEIETSIFFLKQLNEQQRANIKRQKKVIQDIKSLIRELLKRMKTIDVCTQLYQNCLNIISEVKETSRENCLGIEEVYEFYGEDMDERKSGWSYDIVNKLNTVFPRVISKPMITNITALVPPAEKLDLRSALLTSLSFLPIIRIHNINHNVRVGIKAVKQKARDSGWLEKGRGRPSEPEEFKQMSIFVKPGLTARLPVVAFNMYLYGNLVEKQATNIYNQISKNKEQNLNSIPKEENISDYYE